MTISEYPTAQSLATLPPRKGKKRFTPGRGKPEETFAQFVELKLKATVKARKDKVAAKA